jgi:hypothetical protein
MKNPTPGLLKAKIDLRLSEDLSRRIDAWIAAHPEPRPSRPEAIRRILSQALGNLAGAGLSERLRIGTFVKFSSAIKPPDEKYSGQTGIIVAPDSVVAGDPSKDWVRWNDGYECAYPSGTLTRV